MLHAIARRPVDYLGFLPGRLLGGVDGLERVLTGVGHERRADHARGVDVISVDENLVAPAPAVASQGPDPAICHPRRPQPQRAERLCSNYAEANRYRKRGTPITTSGSGSAHRRSPLP